MQFNFFKNIANINTKANPVLTKFDKIINAYDKEILFYNETKNYINQINITNNFQEKQKIKILSLEFDNKIEDLKNKKTKMVLKKVSYKKYYSNLENLIKVFNIIIFLMFFLNFFIPFLKYLFIGMALILGILYLLKNNRKNLFFKIIIYTFPLAFCIVSILFFGDKAKNFINNNSSVISVLKPIPNVQQ